jgi:amino acid transporter
MNLASGIWLAILGILGASNLIIAKKPDAKELIAKLAPYQGWIGASSAIWGAVCIVFSVLGLGLLAVKPLLWVTNLATAVVLFALGLLLGVGVLKTFIKNPEANAKMDQTITKLTPYQGTLGLVAIGLGIWAVVGAIIL